MMQYAYYANFWIQVPNSEEHLSFVEGGTTPAAKNCLASQRQGIAIFIPWRSEAWSPLTSDDGRSCGAVVPYALSISIQDSGYGMGCWDAASCTTQPHSNQIWIGFVCPIPPEVWDVWN